METLWQDVKFGARVLLKSPGFTAVAVLTLALGIGANTAIFSVVNAVLLRQLPYENPERLVMVWEQNRPRSRMTNTISLANFIDWREQNTVFEQMAAFADWRVNLTSVETPEELPVQIATPNLFSLLGAPPLMGRTFLEDDGKQGQNRVVLLSHGFWLRRMGGDPGVVDKTVLLDGQRYTVIGVMPPDFQLYVRAGSMGRRPAELWLPYVFTEQFRVRRGRFAMAVARLKPGVTLEQARAEMDTIGARLEQQYPDFNKGWGVNLVPLREQVVSEVRLALLVLIGAVGFVLLIACANVANLLLARAAVREREIAIRAALGASRGRMLRQLLTESVLLSVAGGALGFLFALWGLDLLLAVTPEQLLPLGGVRLDGRVLGFTLGIALLTGLVFGLLPALLASRPNLTESLKEGGRGGEGTRRARARSVLVAAEIALALVLLICSGLMIRSLGRLLEVSTGFDANNLLTVRLSLPGSKYGQDAQRINFFRELIARVQRIPGVVAAGANAFVPFAGPGSATSFTIEGRPQSAPGEEPVVDVRIVDRDYFRAMRIPLRAGRLFNEKEVTEASHVVIINEAFARQHFADVDPIGQRVTIVMSDNPVPSEIIGVVGDVKHAGLDVQPRAMSYWPHPELAFPFMTLVVRTTGDPLGAVGAIRSAVAALDKDQPIADVRTMNQWLTESTARARFSTVLLSVFAALALVLAAVGIYGVMAYSVAQRTHEIGIRIALGAQSGDILKLVVRQGMLLALAGVVAGIGIAFGVTRFLKTLLYEIPPTDAATFAGISSFLAAVALLACWIPARRATRVEPIVALRYE